MVSDSLDGKRVLLGEVKWSARPFDRKNLDAALRELSARPAPPLPSRLAGAQLVRVLFVPEAGGKGSPATEEAEKVMLITAEDLLEQSAVV